MRLGLLIIYLCIATACGNTYGPSDLTPIPEADENFDPKAVLDEALQDQYRAQTTYENMITSFGAVEPFTSVLEARIKFIDQIKALYLSRGLQLPESQWNINNVPIYSSSEEACAAGVNSEVETIDNYDRLLTNNPDPDMTALFENIKATARDQHKPAFEACSE